MYSERYTGWKYAVSLCIRSSISALRSALAVASIPRFSVSLSIFKKLNTRSGFSTQTLKIIYQ